MTIEDARRIRNEFMDAFREDSDEINLALSADDCRELFLHSLKGSSDLNRKLLTELCDNYDLNLTHVIND